MATIDKYIDALVKNKAESLVLSSGAPVELLTGGASKKLGTGAPGASQVLSIIGEVLPPDFRQQVTAGPKDFPYSCQAGAFNLAVEVNGDKVSVKISPAAAAAAAATPAPTAAAPATQLRPAGTGPTGGPTTKIDALFHKMLDVDASDLHLKSGKLPMVRVHGSMTVLEDTTVISPDELMEHVTSIMPEKNKVQFKETNDTDYAYELTGRARFRCNVFRDLVGVGAVFRQIPTEILTAKDLNLPKCILELCDYTKGLVLVTGPTGSGKSTTLAALINHVNETRDAHIITIEDPVEFVHPDKKCLINQREVGTHTKSFKAALRAALREDPDIVLVGELRDLETTEIAIETAETGHLVFGTLHTNTAPSTIDRIIDQFAADRQGQIRTMLSESIIGVISQTLCKKKDGGRIAALEIMIGTSAISNLIRDAKIFQIPSIMQTSKALGMQSLNDVLIEYTKQKIIDPAEAYAKSVSKKEMAMDLTRSGFRGKWSEDIK